MKLKSTLLSALVFLSAWIFAANPTIGVSLSAYTFCAGDSVTLIIVPTAPLAANNVYDIFIANGLQGQPSYFASSTSQGNDTVRVQLPNVPNGSSYYIGVTGTNTDFGFDPTPITIDIPVVNLLVPDTNLCTFTQQVILTGQPTGGVYSGPYMLDSSFQTSLSGAGTFNLAYTYTDNNGCSSIASQTVHVSVCPSPSVSVQVTPSALCQGGVMTINIQTSDVLAYDNIFTVQLSDANGSFANPTVLVSDTGILGSTLQIGVPVVAAGNYKIRVVASDPSANGVPFNVTFRAQLAPPAISLNADSALSLCTRDTFKLVADSVHGVLYQWTFNGNPLNVSKYSYVARDSGLYVVNFTDTTSGGCSAGADSVFIGIYSYPTKPAISPTGNVDYCGTGSVTLSTTANNAYTFQWLKANLNITGATQNTYATSNTGIYRVKVTNAHGCSTKSDSVNVFIHPNPTVTFNIALDSFCLHSPPILLSGGQPDSTTGGFYTGTYVLSNAIFDQASSGIGAFEIYYTYIDPIGCRGTDSTKIHIYDCTTSGISEVGAQHPFEMFPNPATNQVHISTVGADNCRMKLFNLIGQEVSQQLFSQQLTYSVANLPAGVYMVEVSDISNTWKTVKRLVIQ